MNETPKKIIAVAASVVILGIMYYGSYLPLRKSEDFIIALQTRIHNLQEFTDTFSAPLEDPSPVGQEELVRNIAGSILGIIQNGGGNKDLTKAVIDYIGQYYDPIMSYDRGLNFGQDLYILGAINQTAYEKTGDPAYLKQAQSYFERGLALSPKRPQFLYSIFQIYQVEGDYARARVIGNQILSQWPTDQRVPVAMKSFPDAASSTKGK